MFVFEIKWYENVMFLRAGYFCIISVFRSCNTYSIHSFKTNKTVESFIIYCFPKINRCLYIHINYSRGRTKMEEMRTISQNTYIFLSKILINQIMWLRALCNQYKSGLRTVIASNWMPNSYNVPYYHFPLFVTTWFYSIYLMLGLRASVTVKVLY